MSFFKALQSCQMSQEPLPILCFTPCACEHVFPTTLQAIFCSQLASPSSHRPLSWWVCGSDATKEVAWSPSLEIFKTRLDNSLNNLIRPHCWTYFEWGVGMKTSSGSFHCHLSCYLLITLTPGEEGRQPPWCPTEHPKRQMMHYQVQQWKARYYNEALRKQVLQSAHCLLKQNPEKNSFFLAFECWG